MTNFLDKGRFNAWRITNNLALAFKYAKYEQCLQVKDSQSVAVICKSFALSFNVL